MRQDIEQLARVVVLADSTDLPALVSLQEHAMLLAGQLDEAKSADLAELARKISTLAEALVMRETPDADRAFSEIGAAIEKLQRAGEGASENRAPMAGADVSGEDRALIASWVGSAEGQLTELEARLLELEREPTNKDALAEVRRTLHTLKGECGVLSLHDAQKVCHEAESLVDACVAANTPIPIDPFLQLLDWMRAFASAVSKDPRATAKDIAPIMKALETSGKALLGAVETSPVEASNSAAQAPAAKVESVQATSGAEAAASTERLVFAPQNGTEENLADFLCEGRSHLSTAEESLLALESEAGNADLINAVFRAFHTIKGVSGFMALKPIVALAHSAEQLLDAARSGALALGRRELDLSLASCDMMGRLLGVLEGSAGPTRGELDSLVAQLDAAATGKGAPNASAAPASTASRDAAISSPAALPEPVPTASAGAAPASTPVSEKRPAENDAAAKARKVDQTVKVSTTRMDSLVEMVGELVIAQQMVVQSVQSPEADASVVHRTLGHMSKMVRELQEVSMSLRMVNLKSAFQKMNRLVRDVAQKAGKQIECVTDGEETELDRNVVEAITDPLVHMIRNACDHGVEPAEERRAAGKPAVGRVLLKAYHSGGSIVIEISDDGRGLRREKLLAKAKSKGIIPADADESSMSDSDVFGLIFLPGFSTAEKVTDISGRGVGMDVVRRNIEALRGKVDIRSTPGAGTTFCLRLPLTMAIIDGMVVRVGAQRYVLPTLSIRQSFRPGADAVKTVVGSGELVRVQGSLLPIYRLNRLLNLSQGATSIAEGLLVVVETHDTSFCLMVDEILGQHSVVIKSLSHTGHALKGVSGGAILGDGRVALILDVSQLASLAREGANTADTAPAIALAA